MVGLGPGNEVVVRKRCQCQRHCHGRQFPTAEEHAEQEEAAVLSLVLVQRTIPGAHIQVTWWQKM